MRMVHYYGGLAVLAPPALLVTAYLGMTQGGTPLHIGVGLFTAIYCVAIQTLLILFMVVTGRVLKAAMESRPLAPRFLEELNEFFARKSAYPAALLVGLLTVATAVLGYGELIGVPLFLHPLLGIAMIVANLWSFGLGWRTLRLNQGLMDRVAAELDRIDAEEPDRIRDVPEVLRFSRPTRWVVYALSIWLPYLYWSLVVWRGDFSRVPWELPAVSAVICALSLGRAARLRLRAS